MQQTLFQQWQGLAYSLAGRAWGGRQFALQAAGLDRDDLIQVAQLVLWRTAGRFDPSRGISFGTYFGVAFYRELGRLTGRKHRFGNLSELAEEWIAAPEIEHNRDSLDREQIDDVTARRLDTLPAREAEALHRHLEGETFAAIATDKQLSIEGIRHRYKRAVRHLRAGRKHAA
jgi:RNA polymerase sigma factor (sigma-70 family)